MRRWRGCRLGLVGAVVGLATASLVASGAPAGAASQQFTTDGTFTVPATVCAVTIGAAGGAGGTTSGEFGGAGGAGGMVTATFPVSPGAVLTVVVGQPGANGGGGTGEVGSRVVGRAGRVAVRAAAAPPRSRRRGRRC